MFVVRGIFGAPHCGIVRTGTVSVHATLDEAIAQLRAYALQLATGGAIRPLVNNPDGCTYKSADGSVAIAPHAADCGCPIVSPEAVGFFPADGATGEMSADPGVALVLAVEVANFGPTSSTVN